MPSSASGDDRSQRLRDRLEAEREKLEAQLADDDATRPVELDQQSVGRVSRVDAIQQQQVALAGRQQAERRLRLVRRALARCDREEFGYCLQCGEPIAAARLDAQPFVERCLDCQSAAEHR